MNEFINYTANTSAVITNSTAFTTTITEFKPMKALYLAVDVVIDSTSSSGKTNLLKRVVINSDDNLVSVDSQRHKVNAVGNQTKSSLNFKLTDIDGNTIDLLDNSWSFSLIIER